MQTTTTDPVLIAIAEYARRREVLYSALGAYQEAAEAGDFKEAESAFGAANTAAFLARDAVFKTQPTTTAGALALIRLVAPAIEELGHDRDHAQTLANAIRAAATVLEREGRA